MNKEADDSLEELPPLRLGLQSPGGPPPDSPGDDVRTGRHHWQWWLALSGAVVVGATAGVIGANARNDAIDRNEIMLAAGEVSSVESTEDSTTARVGLGVYNASEFSVKIESFEVDGWARTGAAELVTVEPGTWARP